MHRYAGSFPTCISHINKKCFNHPFSTYATYAPMLFLFFSFLEEKEEEEKKVELDL